MVVVVVDLEVKEKTMACITDESRYKAIDGGYEVVAVTAVAAVLLPLLLQP